MVEFYRFFANASKSGIVLESVKNVAGSDNFISETGDCFWGAERHFFFKKSSGSSAMRG